MFRDQGGLFSKKNILRLWNILIVKVDDQGVGV